MPLEHHALELVVQHEYLDTDAVLRRGLELHRGHAKRRITVDVDDGLVGSADLGTNGGRETEARGLKKTVRNTLLLHDRIECLRQDHQR